ncbi:MAG TPA: 50S ribosomal protein L11 methyltransferase [Armatimonadota bacterium]|jgi:ribosomal protein L11 methyltransferase
MSSPHDLVRAHGPFPARYLNLASGDGILVIDVQAAMEAILAADGSSTIAAEAGAAELQMDRVKRPSAARQLYARLRGCDQWEHCPHGYTTVMSLSAAAPQRIGPFVVRAPWHEAPAEGVDIIIQPGLSFGLGTHATTRIPLRQLADVTKPGMRCADVGCGSGILAIAMSRLGAREVVAVDVDHTAVLEALDNVQRAGVANLVSSISLGSADALFGSFDVIAANMGGAPSVIQIAQDVAAHLEPGGVFLASGIYGDTDDAAGQVADGVSEALSQFGLAEVRRDSEHQCVGIVYRRNR